MADSPVLGLEQVDTASTSVGDYNNRLEEDRATNANRDKVDTWVGSATASFVTAFYQSGTFAAKLGEFYGGLIYNDGGPKTITKVLAFQRNSGSGGVTRIDVRKKAGVPATTDTLFSNNVFKCIVSASHGNLGVRSTSTFVAGSSSWAPGEFIGVVLETATDGPASDLTIQVHWKPSASYAG